MSLTLRADISANQTTIDVVGTDVLAEGAYLEIDAEQVEVRSAMVPAPAVPGEDAYQRLTVERGIEGTARTSHTAATDVTILSGGGSFFPTTERVLTADRSIPDNHSAVVVGPLDLNGHTITFGTNSALGLVNGSASDLYRKKVRVLWSDLTDTVDGVNGKLLTSVLGPDEVLVGAVVVIVQVFDDTGLASMTARLTVADGTANLTRAVQTDIIEPFDNGLTALGSAPALSLLADTTLGATLFFRCEALVNGDGTQGVADVSLIIARAVGPILASTL